MATRALTHSEWEAYLDTISRHLKTTKVEIEVAGMNLGDQVETEWVPLYGISYDSKDDVIEFVVEGCDHLISHPSAVYVDDGVDGLHSIEVLDANGLRHIAKLKEVLKLPPSA